MSENLSPAFLSNLANVYASLRPQAFSAKFLSDLEQIHAILPVASDANLLSLGNHFLHWRKVTQEFISTRLKELPDDDPLLSPISLFRTMDYGRLETAHTRTLAWLLDPKKNDEHGFGHSLLAALLLRLAHRVHFDRFHVDRVASEYSLEGSDGQGRLDVLAEGVWENGGEHVRWTLVVEAKIDAWEGDGQLQKYDEWLATHANGRTTYRVFLTPDGRAPETGSDEWEPMSYLELVRIMRHEYGKLRHSPGFHFLRFYLAGVLQDVCGLPRNVGANAADPYTIASYLKNIHESQSKGESHDTAR